MSQLLAVSEIAGLQGTVPPTDFEPVGAARATLSKGSPTAITSPAGTLTFRQFAAAAEADARSFVSGAS